MLFNSGQFLFFAIAVYTTYYLLPHRAQNVLLLVASYYFYGCWDERFLILILASTLVDYFAALKLVKARREGMEKSARLWLAVSILVNLGILGTFKYFNFFTENFAVFMQTFGWSVSILRLEIILPVGISFYTFQTMSYTIDIYRGRQQPTRNFLDFAVFVAFFPQLMAGPIERSKRLIPQLEKPRVINAENVCQGSWLILWGLFKKVYIADSLSVYCGWVFDRQADLGGLDIILGLFSFLIQIYCDFSGYSDMACGLALLLGIKLSLNFNLPFFASNPNEFWRRWHITLGNWFRDYVYGPVSRKYNHHWSKYTALVLTLLLVGLWHGADWHFVVFGGLWGLCMVGHLLFRPKISTIAKRHIGIKALLHTLGVIFTFYFSVMSVAFFRGHTLAQAFDFLVRAHTNFTSTANFWLDVKSVMFYVLPLIIIQIWQYRKGTLNVLKTASFPMRLIVPLSLLLLLLSNGSLVDNAFIYFQF